MSEGTHGPLVECDRCGGEAVTLIRYSGQHLRAADFEAYVEKRAKREIRKQLRLTGEPVRVACALSGGKDGIPYPVDRLAMDETASLLAEGIAEARLGKRERLRALEALRRFVPP